MADIVNAEIKSNIGEVADDLGKAADNTGKLDKGLKKAKGGVQSLSVGFKSLMKASGIVFLLNEAFTIFKEVLGKNQKVMDIFKTTTTGLSIVFNDFFSFLNNNIGNVVSWFKSIFEDPVQSIEDFGNAIWDNLVERFNSLLDTFGHLGKALGHLVKGEFGEAFNSAKEAQKEWIDVLTGVDNSVDKISKVVKTATTAVIDYTKSVVDQAIAVTETEKAAGRAAVEYAKLNAQYLKEAEEQRQIRDDVSKSFAERIEANNELNEIITKQQELQKEQLQKQIDAAQAQYDINASEENWIALEEQKVAMLELEEAITGQLSEQKTNAVALEQELLDAQNQTRAEGLSGLERELEELETAYKLKVDMARKAGMETTAIDKQFNKEKSAIIQANVNTQLEAYAGLAGALSKLAGDNKALAVAEATIATWLGASKALSATGTPIDWVNAAAIIATGLSNINTILSTDVGGGGGGGGGGSVSSSAAAAQPPAPEMLSGAFGGQITPGGEAQPIQAFVVTDDMTNSQDKLATIRRRATI